VRLMPGSGFPVHYSALAQEFPVTSGSAAELYGRQYIHDASHLSETDLLLVIGWNGMQSHQVPQAPRQLQRSLKISTNS